MCQGALWASTWFPLVQGFSQIFLDEKFKQHDKILMTSSADAGIF